MVLSFTLKYFDVYSNDSPTNPIKVEEFFKRISWVILISVHVDKLCHTTSKFI